MSRKTWFVGGWLCYLVSHVAGADRHVDLPPSFSVKPQLYATGFEFAEGPTFDHLGNLYVVNYRGNGNIGRITREGQASVWCNLVQAAPCEGRRPQANGLKVDAEGAILAADAGAGRLLRVAPDGSKVEVLADRFEGRRFDAVNDVAIKNNLLFFSDPGESSAEKPTGSVYRFDYVSRTVSRLATGLAYPNGLAVTPDGRRLCVGESGRFRVLIYDLLDDGTLGPQQVLINFPSSNQGEFRGGRFEPDGMVFDEQGRLYVAMWTGALINVVELPSGKLLRQYDAGGSQATNCHFFEDSLYVTVAANEAVFRLPLGIRGYNYRESPAPKRP